LFYEILSCTYEFQVVAVGIFEVAPVSCEVPQRFLLSSDLDSTALSQLCSIFRLRLLVSEPWPWDLRGGASELRSSSTFSAFFRPGFYRSFAALFLFAAFFAALFYFSRRRRRRRLLSTSFTQQVPSVHGFKVLLPADLGEGDLLAVFFVAALWFRVLSLHRAAAEELPTPTT